MAAWGTKRWPGERFMAVAERVRRERGARVILFGSRAERPELERLSGGLARVLTGEAGLRNVASVMERCSLFLTNDSGLMHLAASVGTPVVAVFGPTSRELGFFPTGPDDVVVEKDLPCRPCSLHGGTACPERHFLCMDGISIDEVHAEVARRISAVRVSPAAPMEARAGRPAGEGE